MQCPDALAMFIADSSQVDKEKGQVRMERHVAAHCQISPY
jgi:hypothetical protein